MRCGHGRDAEDCATIHWCESLAGSREPASWRADSPCCHLYRVLSWWAATDWRIDWRCHCPCSRAAVQAALAEALPCFPGSSKPGRGRISADNVIELALSGMQPMSMRLALLEMAGLSTPEALDKLGVSRGNRSRVIAGRASKRMQNRR